MRVCQKLSNHKNGVTSWMEKWAQTWESLLKAKEVVKLRKYGKSSESILDVASRFFDRGFSCTIQFFWHTL